MSYEEGIRWRLGDGRRWPTAELWEGWAVLWFRWRRVNLSFWRNPRTWAIGAHRGECCALNLMFGPLEFMLTHSLENL